MTVSTHHQRKNALLDLIFLLPLDTKYFYLCHCLSLKQLKTRDEVVFSTFYDLGIPVPWNLAGGYQDPFEKVLDIHKTTYEIALSFC